MGVCEMIKIWSQSALQHFVLKDHFLYPFGNTESNSVAAAALQEKPDINKFVKVMPCKFNYQIKLRAGEEEK